MKKKYRIVYLDGTESIKELTASMVRLLSASSAGGAVSRIKSITEIEKDIEINPNKLGEAFAEFAPKDEEESTEDERGAMI